MKFEEVLPELRKGKRIRRKDIGWENVYSFLFISETRKKIFSDNAENHDYKLTKEDLLANDWEIVKESKKVKFRDLTKEQYGKWIKNNCTRKYGENCEGCPFRITKCSTWISSCWINHKESFSDKFLDQEIEVEEDD